MTVFCKLFFSEKQKLPRIFNSWKKAKNFYMSVPFKYNSKKIPTINLWNFTPKVKLFFVEKGNLKFSDEKM